MKCRLHTDLWADIGVIYTVQSYERKNEPTDSSAVQLVIEYPDGSTLLRTVSVHQIEWIEEDES